MPALQNHWEWLSIWCICSIPKWHTCSCLCSVSHFQHSSTKGYSQMIFMWLYFIVWCCWHWEPIIKTGGKMRIKESNFKGTVFWSRLRPSTVKMQQYQSQWYRNRCLNWCYFTCSIFLFKLTCKSLNRTEIRKLKFTTSPHTKVLTFGLNCFNHTLGNCLSYIATWATYCFTTG